MDALIFADGVGLVGKAGRPGTILSKLPKFVSDETAGKILGPALDPLTQNVSRYGGSPIGSFSRAGGKFEELKLAANPLLRVTQKGIYRRMSLTPEEAALLPAAETARGAEVLAELEPIAQYGAKYAGALEPRVLRPAWGKWLSSHENSKILSTLRVNLGDRVASEVTSKTAALKDSIIREAKEAGQEIDDDLVFKYDQGLAVPPGDLTSLTAPISIPHPRAREIAWNEVPELGPYQEPAAKAMSRIAGRGENFDSFETPYTAVGGGRGVNSFKLVVDDLEDADRAAAEALTRAGYGQDIRVFDTLKDPENFWAGLDYFGKNAAGQEMHLSVGSRKLLETQDAVAELSVLMKKFDKDLINLKDDLAKAPNSAEATRLADEWKFLMTERAALRVHVDDLFEPARASFWEAKGVPYDKNLKLAFETRAIRQAQITNSWMRLLGEKKASLTKLMERRFTVERHARLTRLVSNFVPDLRRILEKRLGNLGKVNRVTADHYAYLELVKYLNKQGIPDNLIESILLKEPWKQGKTVQEAAVRLAVRARKVLHPYTITEGGAGARFGFAPFDWMVMLKEFKDAGKPLPFYLPHYPAPNPSQMALKSGGKSGLVPQPPGFFSKDWNGILFDEGRVDTDIVHAIDRAGRLTIQYEELKDFLDKTTSEFSRAATREDYRLASAGDARFEGEFFYNPKQINALLDLRKELMTETIMNVPRYEGDVLKATTEAFKSWQESVTTTGLNSLDGELRSIPIHIAEGMNREIKLQLGNSIKMFWDTPQKVWKASVLSLSPRWVLNNVFGNLFFVGLENPGAMRHVVSQFDQRNRALIASIFGYDPIRITESGFFHDVGGRIGEAGATYGPKASRLREVILGDKESDILLARMNVPSRAVQSWSKNIRNLNSYVEEAFRRGILVDEISRTRIGRMGKDLESLTKTFQRDAAKGFGTEREMGYALERVDRVIGNFTRYSPVEQGIVRRFFMPFYGFYRHMVNVLLKMPFEHPLKSQVMRQIGEMDEIMYKGVPSYLRDQAAVHLGEVLGGDTWLRLKNLNPLSQITEEFGPINLINPAFKLAIERSLGVSTLTGEPFDIENLGLENEVVQTQNGEYWKILRDGDGNVIDVIRTTRPVPEILSHIGSQFGIISMLPSFQQYPKSFEQNLASWAGISTSQPHNGTEAALAYDQEVHDEALAKAIGGSSPFGSFGSFGSF